LSSDALEAIRQGLSAGALDDRIRALQRAAALGEAARALAPDVAKLLADENYRVWTQAAETFKAIGHGAAEAVPVLLALRSHWEGRDFYAVKRATIGLGVIGASARAAVPDLLATVKKDPHDFFAIRALGAIAPDAPEVLSRLLDLALSGDSTKGEMATRALTRTDGPLVDRLFDAIEAAVGSGASGARSAAGLTLGWVAPMRPERAAAIALELLAGEGTFGALHVVSKLPRRWRASLIEPVIRVAAGPHPNREAALTTIVELGPEAAAAQEPLLALLREKALAVPRSGPEGAEARLFTGAALGVARACPTDEAVPLLLAWLDRVHGEWLSAGELNWSGIADVVEALSELAPRSAVVCEAMVRTLGTSRPLAHPHFEGRVCSAFARMPNADEMFDAVDRLGPRLGRPVVIYRVRVDPEAPAVTILSPEAGVFDGAEKTPLSPADGFIGELGSPPAVAKQFYRVLPEPDGIFALSSEGVVECDDMYYCLTYYTERLPIWTEHTVLEALNAPHRIEPPKGRGGQWRAHEIAQGLFRIEGRDPRHVFCASGIEAAGDEFKHIYDEHGFRGLIFEEVWRSRQTGAQGS
jgi:hypothetical protein